MKTYTNIPAPDKKIVTTYRELLEKMVDSRPDMPLISLLNYKTNEKKNIMPAEFLHSVDMLGRWFAAHGCKRDNVAILADNSYEWILTMFSVICSDNILVTLDKGLEMPSLEYIIENSDSKVLLYSAAFAEKAKTLAEKYGLDLYAIEDISQFIAQAEELPDNGKIETDCDAPAILMYTSGTTGLPKGVILSQKNTLSNLQYAAMQDDYSGDSVYLLPLNHIYGLGSALLITFINRNTVTINTNMRYMMNDILAGKPEILFIVPLFVQTLYNAFRKFLKAKGLADKIDAMIAENNRKGNVTAAEKRAMFAEVLTFFGGRLSRIVSGGAPLDMESCNGFADFGITVLNGYGITECSPVLAVNPIVNNKPESVGKVIKSLEVKIENPDENGYGEICAKGSSIMMGYYKNDAENAKSLIDGWFHTGDKGWMDDEDYLYICGRIKNLIILANGENVSPEEIEGFIYQQIKAVAEVVVYDKNGHITAQIFKNDDYIQENGIEDAENYIRDAISALNLKLAIYKRIAEVEFRDTPFDKTTSKKIKRIL